MKQILAFLKKKDLYLGIVRYLLGLTMITYAITKILRTQFVVLPFAVWQRPLESLTGRNIAWAFLGYSPWFQVLLGFLELVPSLLLLFRRTTLGGAILLLPVTLNVYLINMALNLWDGTKTISLFLLILNFLVLLFEWKKMLGVVMIVINSVKLRFTLTELLINLVLIAAVGYMALTDLLDYRSQRNALTGDWLNQHPYEWKLVSETIGDSTLTARNSRTYYGAYGSYSELNDTSYSRDATYELDEKKHQLNFITPNNKKQVCVYKITGDTILQIDRPTDSIGHAVVRQVYKRRVINKKLFTRSAV